jgi:hypothetical protein
MIPPAVPWDRDETLRLCAIQVAEVRNLLEGWRSWPDISPETRLMLTNAIRLLSQNELAARLRAVREQP